MTRSRSYSLTLFLVTLLFLAPAETGGGQASPGVSQPELIVAAAADLVFALREIAPIFEKEHQVRVTLTFGSTGQLAQQIQHGAPVDVFFAANVAFVEDLRAKGQSSRTVYSHTPRGRSSWPLKGAGRRSQA